MSKKKDINELAKHITDIAIGDKKPEKNDKNPAAVALGKLGGKKGGKARADALSPERRKDIAKKAAKARWKDKQ